MKVIIILDGSGSMTSIRSKTIEGFNNFLIEQQADDEPTSISVYTFHGYSIQTIVEDVPVNEASPLTQETYVTNGYTNLLDAIGFALAKHDQGVFCIITDGEENCSREYSWERLKALIEAREASGSSFIFLGTNIESWSIGSRLGMQQDSVYDFSANNIGHTMKLASTTANALKRRSVGEDYLNYTQALKNSEL